MENRNKRKIESGDEADTISLTNVDDSPSPDEMGNKLMKRQRVSRFNFSIESIMKSELEPSSGINDRDLIDNDTPSLSPTSSTTSNSSSIVSEVEVEHLAMPARDQVQQHEHQHQHQQQQRQQQNYQAQKVSQNENQTQQQQQQQQRSSKKSSSSSSSSGSTWSEERGSGNSSNFTNQLLKPKICHEPRLAPFHLSQVECQLDNKDMWDKFHSLNTEMIITKTGRRMFPVMKVQFHNLNPNARYSVMMDIVPVDNKRYRYAYHKSCWQVAGKADPSAETRLYPHPDSPFNGDLLSRQVISFEKVKLTNNEMDKSGHIILNSMHKYQPRVHLFELNDPPPSNLDTTTAGTTTSSLSGAGLPSASRRSTSSSSSASDHHINNNHHNYNHHHHNHHHMINKHHHQNHHTTNHHHHSQPHNHHQQLQNNNNNNSLQPGTKDYRTFVFPETVFTAVTAYQNQLITKMKIDKNPFAKGFRDSSRLSDLDRNDPFDYIGSLGPSGRFVNQPGRPGSLDAAAGAAAHMDAYQILASAANNPWYSAAAVAAATSQSAATNPFNPMVGATACSNAQQAQLQATQMLLAAFSACLNNGSGNSAAGPGGGGVGPGVGLGGGLGGTSTQSGPDQ